jgi:predicted nucleic acid-binding protein
MSPQASPIAVLDACVLYPAPLRDLLLSLADVGLFMPLWSQEIQEEWIHNLLLNRPDLTKQQLSLTQVAMDLAFPNARIGHYENLIPTIQLRDQNDRHVVAAAIKGNAALIITFNLKDFPKNILEPLGLSALHPDVFLSQIVSSNPLESASAFRNMLNRLKKPPMSRLDLLQTLQQSGLTDTVEKLRLITYKQT